ncbi:MAG TPA: alpha/beta hydrolase domain-containing protein [Gemmataceae bacterium]|nr:alpha/beta hydrolase domain-containing protein [Gemmataceae bacterium]
MRLASFALGCMFLLLSPPVLLAELVSLDIRERQPFANDISFGNSGPYEKITGVARFAIDPKHPCNKAIVDLNLAPRNADGKVEFETDFVILAPKNPSKGNGALFYDVNNRGNKLALRFFNYASGGNDLDKPKSEGDGFLMRRGYTIVWCGWIGELLPGDHRLLLHAPIATDAGTPIRGIVRYEMSTDTPADSLPLSRREGHGSYSPTKEGEARAVLTWRMRETDQRVVIPRGQWSLQRQPLLALKDGVPATLRQVRLKLAGGFRPGYIYELICEAEGPLVQGCGYTAVRDLISFLRCNASNRNPFLISGKPAFNRAIGFGVSQSGRFLRNFTYLGFNADENQRIVFDGLMPHVAGGGLGFFNHRFAQPTRFAGQHEDHTYPVDYFPFTYGPAVDPFSKKTDNILSRYPAGQLAPKIIHTQSAAEYWHRSGSLVHTDPLGTKDALLPKEVRVFAFGGTQHGPAADPPPRSIADNLTNPGDYRPYLRAFLDALDSWVKDGTEPPASVYPRIDKGTLVHWNQKSTGFPALPGVRYPEAIQQPACLDFGPRFADEGIITVAPPRVVGKYVVLVPRSDPDGNDLGTLLPPEVAVPLATYTGWNLRRREAGAEAMLANLLGSYIPFPRTKAERLATGDPRSSLEERYGSFASYQRQFTDSCNKLIGDRYLLGEDARRLIAAREKYRNLFEAGK